MLEDASWTENKVAQEMALFNRNDFRISEVEVEIIEVPPPQLRIMMEENILLLLMLQQATDQQKVELHHAFARLLLMPNLLNYTP